MTVVPADAGTHFGLCRESALDSGFRRNDGLEVLDGHALP